MPAYSFADLLALAPAIVLLLGSLVLLMIEVFQESQRRSYQAWFTAVTAVVAGLAAIPMLSGEPHPILAVAGRAAFAVADRFGGFVTIVICAGLALSALVASTFLHERRAERGEFYVLAMLSASGMILLVQGTDLLFIFVAIEIMSVATYALATWLRRGVRPSEAAFKYFILGAFSSALYLYGVALIFGATGGKTALAEVAASVAQGGPLLAAGIALVAAGFAFKVAAVPFHMWAPDVYEGSPTPVTAFMAVGVKAAAFAALLRVLVVAFGAESLSTQDGGWGEVVVVLSVLTMLLGNLLAIPQRSVKRLLAYSSIAHAGYILVGVAAAQDATARASATEGILYYLAAYTFTAVGAFAVVGALERVDGDGPMSWDLDRFAGIARTHPALGAAMAVFMVSLAGIPPTAGFIGKLYVFRAALDAELYWLAIIGVLTSVIGAYYYLRVVIAMFMTERETTVQVAPASSLSLNLALLVAVIGTLALGVLPSLIGEAARASVLALGAG